LNKAIEKLLQSFSYSTEWTDIINWLKSLEAVLRDNPSPYINEKVILSKRLNQCINPILPEKVHEQVLIIHQLLFQNIRMSVDNNINEYIKLFADDLGTRIFIFRNVFFIDFALLYSYNINSASFDDLKNPHGLLLGFRSSIDSYANGNSEKYFTCL
jgi:hypothetical protein